MPVTALKHIARVRVRPGGRQGRPVISEAIKVANLEIRPKEFDVLVDGRRAGLTVREYKLLTALASNPDTVMQRPDIYEVVWGGTMRHRDRSVDVVVRKVRSKLEIWAPDWRYIHTHFAVGYRFHPERAATAGGGTAAVPDRRRQPWPPPAGLAQLRAV